MGLFDAFTGDPAKEAAEKNRANLAALKTEGMGYLDAGKSGALGALGNAVGAYAPVSALGEKYGAAGDMMLNALGLNGQGGKDAALSAFQGSNPGFQFQLDTGLDALDRRAASRGMLGSGNTNLDTLNYSTGLANQSYQNWLSGLSGLTTLGANETNMGAAGQAAGYSAMAPVYSNDANQRVGLASNVTNGINSQNTQQANAEMQASGNMFNGLMSLGQLAMAIPTGGTSMLGGLGSLGGVSSALGGIY